MPWRGVMRNAPRLSRKALLARDLVGFNGRVPPWRYEARGSLPSGLPAPGGEIEGPPGRDPRAGGAGSRRGLRSILWVVGALRWVKSLTAFTVPSLASPNSLKQMIFPPCGLAWSGASMASRLLFPTPSAGPHPGQSPPPTPRLAISRHSQEWP